MGMNHGIFLADWKGEVGGHIPPITLWGNGEPQRFCGLHESFTHRIFMVYRYYTLNIGYVYL
jgi:hypothetical protein